MSSSANAESVDSLGTAALGHPRKHLRQTDSTNEQARKLAIAGAPHGALVTAAEQTAGRGRQGRAWSAPAGRSLLCSLVLRDPPPLLSLRAGVAVCDVAGERARLKWPNDVVLERAETGAKSDARSDAKPDARSDATSDDSSRSAPAPPTLAKLAGVLVEARPQGNWAVLGIGVNVAVRIDELPEDVRAGATSLERPASAIEPLLAELLLALTQRLGEPAEVTLDAWRELDALRGRDVAWAYGRGRVEGIDREGRLLVRVGDGSTTALSASEVHLASSA